MFRIRYLTSFERNLVSKFSTIVRENSGSTASKARFRTIGSYFTRGCVISAYFYHVTLSKAADTTQGSLFLIRSRNDLIFCRLFLSLFAWGSATQFAVAFHGQVCRIRLMNEQRVRQINFGSATEDDETTFSDEPRFGHDATSCFFLVFFVLLSVFSRFCMRSLLAVRWPLDFVCLILLNNAPPRWVRWLCSSYRKEKL